MEGQFVTFKIISQSVSKECQLLPSTLCDEPQYQLDGDSDWRYFDIAMNKQVFIDKFTNFLIGFSLVNLAVLSISF